MKACAGLGWLGLAKGGTYIYSPSMALTLLHLSDLHRDSGSRVGTPALVESIRLDVARYVDARNGVTPDLAIVSGDIVFGVTGREVDPSSHLAAQYREAEEFLVALTETLFGGDRERVVLTPGNHDISHPHVTKSLEFTPLPTAAEKLKAISRQLDDEVSPWRWDSDTFSLFRIADPDCYRGRLEPYANFYQSFYQGKRSFSLDPSKQYSIHEFADLGLVVAALSSCCDNDLFNRAGRIHPDCIAGATRAVARQVRSGQVPIAVWHHNLAGRPKVTDYVDPDVLQSLIDGGFVIGLHGHQHRAQYLDHRFTADAKRGISVISAGTLCGGPQTLPPGRMRGYNLIALDLGTKKGAVHVREMQNQAFERPVWGPAHVNEFAGSSMEFDLKMLPIPPTPSDVWIEAGQLLQANDPQKAFEVARPHMTNEIARRIVLQALSDLNDWAEIENLFSPPQSIFEFMALGEALYSQGKREELSALIDSSFVKNTQVAGVQQYVDLMRSRMGGK